MNNPQRPIKREDVLRLAVKARLMLDAGDACFVSDLAGAKEVVAFARLLESRLCEQPGSSLADTE
ncbi:hypothetical protein [Noviherbaspirillum denitrificans]|uniref:Uncharacterized protein n=1 Tax=Noviherbaspirillum denitrificans TaxID=1968433 RepID=A0A254TM27_9BURK|nr:hypothetical protein [Noviherbaspirillum denitrificans]OWW22392.1 hypothetical protein AYR66_25745 [Noviherbaspirillum denitrificans]